MRLEARPLSIILKGVVIFLAINLAFAAANLPPGRLSIYNTRNGIRPANGDPPRLFFDVLPVTQQAIGRLRVWAAEEYIFIAPRENFQIRYNELYPRWAFDRVLELVRVSATSLGWQFDDFHDLVPYAELTDDVHHLTPQRRNPFGRRAET